MRENDAGKGGGEHQHQQPGGAGLPRLPYAGLQIRLVGGEDGGHLLDVLRDLFLQNVHGVVHGDDAHQTILRVHHRQRQEVVLAEGTGGGLLVVQGLHADEVALHDVADDVVLLRQQQRPDGQHADQVALFIDDITDVDGLLVRSGTADALEGVLHGHGLLQVHELRGHDAAGGVIRIFEDLVDTFAHFRVRVAQNTLDHIGRHLLHDVHRVVQIQLVQHFFQLRVGKALDQQLLLVTVQLHEHLCRQLLGQQAEHQRHLFPQFAAQRGDVCGLQGQQKVTQGSVLFSGQQILDFFHQCVPVFFQLKHAVRPPFCVLTAMKNKPSVRPNRYEQRNPKAGAAPPATVQALAPQGGEIALDDTFLFDSTCSTLL